MSTSPLQAPETISTAAQLAFDGAKAMSAVETLPDSEKAVVNLHAVEGNSIERTAEKLGRTPYWVETRYKRAMARLRETMGIHVQSSVQANTPAVAVQNFQQEHTLKSAILEKFKTGHLDRRELGELFWQLHEMLSKPGRAGQFSPWLEANGINRGFARYCMTLARPIEQEAGADDAAEPDQFSPDAAETRKKKLLRIVNKFYDLHSGMNNKAQVLADFDILTSQIREHIAQLV